MPVLSYRGEPPTFPSLTKQEKEKKHCQIRVKLSFIKYDDNFYRVLPFKSYNISTDHLCIDNFLTTTKCNCVFPL